MSPEILLPLSPQVFHILVALADGDRHGYSIMQDVASRTNGKLRLSAGTLYGSVKRMLEQGLIVELRESERPETDDDERRRYYRLTAFGRRVARAEAERLSQLLRSMRGLMAWRPNAASLYRALLLAYPADFREEFGTEMEPLIRDRLDSEPGYGVSAADPLTFIAAPLLLLMASMAACLIPAWRATRINPLAALRCE